MRAERTQTAAMQMLRDPYYKLLRNTEYGFGYPAQRAFKAVKEYDALTKGIEITNDPEAKQTN